MVPPSRVRRNSQSPSGALNLMVFEVQLGRPFAAQCSLAGEATGASAVPDSSRAAIPEDAGRSDVLVPKPIDDQFFLLNSAITVISNGMMISI